MPIVEVTNTTFERILNVNYIYGKVFDKADATCLCGWIGVLGDLTGPKHDLRCPTCGRSLNALEIPHDGAEFVISGAVIADGMVQICGMENAGPFHFDAEPQ